MDIPDFSESELWLIRQTLEERYGEPREIELADAEVRINPEERTLTECPVAVWQDETSDATFVVFKLGADGFRAQFFYRGYQQYGVADKNFDDLAECVITILQVQADLESKRRAEL